MSTLTPQQIKEAFRKLPQTIQELYFSEDVGDTASDIGDKHDLHIDQIGKLGDEIGLVMLGITPTQEFASHIMNRLAIDKAKADAITNDVNNEIFVKIRQAVKEASMATETMSPVTPPPQAPTQEQLIKEIGNPKPPPAASVFEEKMAKVFSLKDTKDDATPLKPWEEDPYLEKP